MTGGLRVGGERVFWLVLAEQRFAQQKEAFTRLGMGAEKRPELLLGIGPLALIQVRSSGDQRRLGCRGGSRLSCRVRP